MKAVNLLCILMLVSCATRKKTIIYSAIASSLAGALVGKAVSPNDESNSVNMAGGMIVGAIVGGAYGDSVYKDRHPDVEMDIIPLKNEEDVKSEEFKLGSLGIPIYVPEIVDSTDKSYVNVDKEHSKIARRQYVIEHQANERSIITNDGRKFIYPAIKIIEVGIENE